MTTIAEIKQQYPDLADSTDDQVVDALHQAFYADLPRDEIAAKLGVKSAPAAAEPSGMVRRVVGDSGVSLLKGAIGVPESAVGLADLVTGGRAGKLAEQAGFRPKEAKAQLDELYSPEQKAANAEVQNAHGFVDVAKAALSNPSVIAHSALESLPAMGAGGVVGRGALALAPKIGSAVAAGLGEGVTTMGQQAESVRQETADGLLTGTQAALAAGSGLATGAIGVGAGRLAQKLGIENVETLLVGGHADPAVKTGLVRRVIGGAVTEGLLEELPQSVQEQVAQNLALGKPLDEGVDQAAVLGVLTGGAMGVGAQAFHGNHAPVKSAGDVIREDLQPQVGPLTAAVNAGIEDAAQKADAAQPLVDVPHPPRAANAAQIAAIRGLPPEQQQDALHLSALGNRMDVAPGVRRYAQNRLDKMLGDLQPLNPPQIDQKTGEPVPEPTPTVAAPKPGDEQDQALARQEAALRASDAAAQAQRERDRPPIPTGEPQDGDLLNLQNKPFTTMPGAMAALRNAAPGSTLVRVAGGLVVRPAPAPSIQPESANELGQPAGPGTDQGTAPVVAAAPGGNGPVVSAEPQGGPSGRPVAEPVAGAAAPHADAGRADDLPAVAQPPAAPIAEFVAAPAPAPVAAEAPVSDVKDTAAAPTARHAASWVIREKATGKVIAETFDRKKVDALNTEKYEAVPILEHLQGLNVATKAAAYEQDASHGTDAPAQAEAAPAADARGDAAAPVAAEPAGPAVAGSAEVEPTRLKPKVYKSKGAAQLAQKGLGNTHKLQPVKGGFILRQKSDKELAAEEKSGQRLKKGASTNVDRDSLLTAIAKAGGLAMREKSDTITEGNRNAGGRNVFTKTGAPIDLMATTLHEDGFIPPHEYENDGGVTWLRDAIASEFAGLKTHYSQNGDEWMRARYEASRPLEDFDAEALAESGYTALAPSEQEAAEALLVDAEHLANLEAGEIAERNKADWSENAIYEDLDEAAPAAGAETVAAHAGAVEGSAARESGEGAARGGEPAAPQAQPETPAEGLTLTAPTKAQVIAQQDALEQERADKEAPADKPKSKLTGEQVDIFNPQGSVFDVPAEPAPDDASKPEPAIDTSEKRVEAPTVAEATHKVGDLVKLTKPGVNGRVNIAGTITQILPDGRLEIRTQNDGYMKVAPSDLGHKPSATPKEAPPKAQADEQDRNGLREEDRRLRDLGAASGELAAQIANDMLDGQYATPADRAEMAPGLAHFAEQAKVPADDLRAAVLRHINDDERLTKRQTKQIADALNPAKEAKPAKKPTKAEREAAELEARRADYFTPGNIIKGYGGFDEVLAYNPPDASGRWSVRVQEVKKIDGQWVRVGKPQDARNHSTQPDERNLKDGPVARVAAAPAAEVPHTEPRADGKAFPNATARVATPEPAAKVEDFGEKLEGARKDAAPSLREDLGDDAIATQPFSKIWPADEAAGIEDKFTAAVATAARAEVPPKPRTQYKVDRWVEKVKAVRSLAQFIVRGTVTKEQFAEKLKSFRGLEGFAAKVALMEAIDRDQWSRIGAVSEAPDAYNYEDGKQIKQPMVRVEVDGKNHWLEGSGSVLDHVDAVNALLGVEAKAKPMQFEVRGSGQSFSINKKGDKKYRKLKTFTTAKEALDYVRSNNADLVAAWDGVKERDNVKEADVRGEENRPRSAEDWRQGKDVTSEQFSDAFGFRGVQFGNWVGQGVEKKARQGMLNQAYDALMDLATIVQIPPRAVSLNGTLGLAFGARGSGGASAHYEPDTFVINLTKTRGAGTLAHEWFHALDNYFSHKRGAVPMSGGMTQTDYRKANYVTYKPEALYVRKDGRGTALTKERLEQIRKTSTGAYYAPDAWHVDPKHPQGIRPEVEQRFADLVKALDESPMKARAQLNDKAPEGYWSRIIERAARSFENYVISKMMEKGYHNDYLANVKPVEDFSRDKGRYPYLLPAEVAPVAAAFDALFGEVQTKADDSGNVAMFSRSPTFNAAVDAAIEAGMKGERPSLEHIAIGTTTPVLRAASMSDGDLRTTPTILAKAVFDHGVTKSMLKRLPDLLENPVMVLDSATGPGRFVVVTSESVGGRPLLVVISPEETRGAKSFNFVPSVYPKDDLGAIQRWLNDGKLRYLDKEQSPQWFGSTRLQLPSEYRTARGLQGKNVATNESIVKPPADGPTASRTDKAPADRPAEITVRAAEVKALVDKITSRWANAPEVVVVHDLADENVPEAVRQHDTGQRSEGATGDIEGFYYKGKVYLVADRLGGDADVLRVLMHESLGHYGLRHVFGQQLGTILDRMAILQAGKVRDKARQYGLDFEKQRERRAAAEEVLAELAQTNPELGWVQQAIAAIRTWIRDHIPGAHAMKLSDAEVIRSYIIPARQYVKAGEVSVQRTAAPVTRTDPMFSRSLGGALDQALGNVKNVNLPAGYKVADLMDSAGKLSVWHKTVGSQYNLAQRSPTFKRVFDGVQTFLNDASYYTNEAANLAPKVLPKLEGWKDIAKSPLSAADTKAISAPIFEGTLNWARDAKGKAVQIDDLKAAAAAMDSEQKARALFKGGHLSEQVLKMWQGLPVEQFDSIIDGKYERDMLKAGVVWTDEELRNQFHATPEQISLYREFRAATDESLSNLATSEMINYAGKDADAVRAQAMTLSHDEAAVLLRDHLFALAEAEPARADALNEAGNKMIEIADHATDMQKRGYAPLSRFGTYTLDATLPTGERYFSLFETTRERARMQRQLNDAGATDVKAGTMSQEDYKLLNGISPETAALFGEMLGLDRQGSDAKDAAFAEFIKRGTSNRSALKRLLKRQGIAGFSEDAGRVLAGFVYSNGRKTSSNLHMGEVTNAVNDMDKQGGELKDTAVRLADYVKNPQEEAQGLRGLLFAQYLGGSVASAMVNATQPFTVTFPYLSQFGGVGKAAKQMAAAVKVAGKKTTGDAELDKAIHLAEEQGTISPQETHQLMAMAQGKSALKSGDGTALGNATAKASNVMAKVGLAWGKVFSLAEQFNRRITFIAAYRTAQEQGIADPAAFAEKAVNETQFISNKGNKPTWARGAIGGVLFTFKSYSVQYLELLQRMATAGEPGSPERAAGRKAALLAVGVLFLMGGADGLPFEANIEDLIDAFMQHLGYNFSSKREKQAFFANLFGEDMARVVNKGLSGLPGAPIDVSGRMGMGRLIPGTGLFAKKADHTSDVAELFGPVGDLAKRAGTAVGQLLDGDVIGAGATMSPVASRNLQKSVDMLKTDSYRDAKGRKVIDTTPAEAILKAIGFQPNSVARVQEATGEIQQAVALTKLRTSELTADMAQAVFEKDEAKKADVRTAMQRWNESNPEAKITINMASVIQRVKAMREDKATRIEKTAPKSMRAEVRRELQGAQ
jgi:hypothetical protein